MSFYDRAAGLRRIQIEKYEFAKKGRIDEGEASQCNACGATSRTPGTPTYLWARIDQSQQPATVQLCEFCEASAGGAM
jgi:hypothetical protein